MHARQHEQAGVVTGGFCAALVSLSQRFAEGVALRMADKNGDFRHMVFFGEKRRVAGMPALMLRETDGFRLEADQTA